MPVPGANAVVRPHRQLAREEVFETIHEWIVCGTLLPGEYLREQELAEALGVSRTPIREALRRLENVGLVQSEANRSTRVTLLDIGDVQNIYPLLELLEPYAIRLSEGRITVADLDELDATNARITVSVKEAIPGGAAMADEAFHRLLSSHCGNPELIKVIAEFRVKLRRMAHGYFLGRIIAEHSVVEHQAVIDAMRAGDFERAATASAGHWRGSLDRFLLHTGAGT